MQEKAFREKIFPAGFLSLYVPFLHPDFGACPDKKR
jgi:hypothetical protein